MPGLTRNEMMQDVPVDENQAWKQEMTNSAQELFLTTRNNEGFDSFVLKIYEPNSPEVSFTKKIQLDGAIEATHYIIIDSSCRVFQQLEVEHEKGESLIIRQEMHMDKDFFKKNETIHRVPAIKSMENLERPHVVDPNVFFQCGVTKSFELNQESGMQSIPCNPCGVFRSIGV